jgi:hypothetical protein
MDPWLKSTPVQVSNRSWVERSTGIAPTITNACARTCSAGSTASPPISPNIHEQVEARLGPFIWKTILVAEDLGAAPTPLVHAQVQC